MAKKFLTLNIGASGIALAEYEAGSGGALTLVNYGLAPLAAPLDAGNADAILAPALMQIVREKGIKPGKVAVSVSGQMVFPRMAAIAMAGGEDKFEQMVRYEIEQNIPFPLDEMVCDRQILGETENGDKAVMIVAAKIEQMEAVTGAVASAGFTPEIVDVAPLALTNAMRSLVGDDGSCVVMLDIGAKTTSLVIAEGEKLYNRSIPVAGNTLTKEIAQALGCTLEEAEQYKRESAYVSQGGVTEDSDPTLDRISKVCRAVLTRLHAEISRSINFYRSQQHGGTPVKLYLTGGTALLPQIDAFFADSLGLEVEFFNPFAAMRLGPSLNAEQTALDSAFLSATAGLAVHAANNASIAINLLPPSIIEARAEVRRIPVVALGAVAFVVAAACVLAGVNRSISVVEAQQEAISGMGERLKNFEAKIKAATEAETAQKADAEAVRALVAKRVAPVIHINAVKSAISDLRTTAPAPMWIQSWETLEQKQDDGTHTLARITIRGWKDRIDAFIKDGVDKDRRAKTAPELVVANLKANKDDVKTDTVSVKTMSTVGKDASIEQFVVELEFNE